jgi:hypothetical protein
MTGLVCGLLACGLLATTALAAAATLRLRSLAEFALAAYLLAYGEAVLLVLVLSRFGAVERPVLLVGLAIPCVVAASAWWWRGHPLPDVSGLRRVASLLRSDRIFWPLGGVVALALAYTVALIVGTPPNNGDSLAYHLARAAFWRQDGGIDYIPDTYDVRMNVFPPNTEAVLTLLMEVTRSERALGFVQFGSLLACAVAVFALARRIRCSEREATFGALVFLTLPTVLLQASTTKNDLVVAASLLAATVFLVGERRWPNHAFVVLAVALAVGTKVTALFALPLLGVVAIGVRPAGQRLRRLLALAAGIALGSYWYVVNVFADGRVQGKAEAEDSAAIFDLQRDVLNASALVQDVFDLSGAPGWDIFVYALVAGLFLAAAVLARRHHGEPASLVRAGLFVAIFPLGVLVGSYLLQQVFETLDDHLEASNDLLPRLGWAAPTRASESFSWFGPVGLLLLVAAGATGVVLARRRSLSRLALLFGLAPLVWLIFVAASLPYHPSYGRYFIFPVALSATLWGLALRVREWAWAICALAVTTMALSLVHFLEKPSGLRLLEGGVPESVWGADRWRVYLAPQPETPAEAFRFLVTLPRHDSVALALRYNDLGYPAFGPRFERRVELVPDGSDGRTVDAMWLLANASRADTIDATCWRPVVESPEGWVGFRRRDACRQ